MSSQQNSVAPVLGLSFDAIRAGRKLPTLPEEKKRKIQYITNPCETCRNIIDNLPTLVDQQRATNAEALYDYVKILHIVGNSLNSPSLRHMKGSIIESELCNATRWTHLPDGTTGQDARIECDNCGRGVKVEIKSLADLWAPTKHRTKPIIFSNFMGGKDHRKIFSNKVGEFKALEETGNRLREKLRKWKESPHDYGATFELPMKLRAELQENSKKEEKLFGNINDLYKKISNTPGKVYNVQSDIMTIIQTKAPFALGYAKTKDVMLEWSGATMSGAIPDKYIAWVFGPEDTDDQKTLNDNLKNTDMIYEYSAALVDDYKKDKKDQTKVGTITVTYP